MTLSITHRYLLRDDLPAVLRIDRAAWGHGRCWSADDYRSYIRWPSIKRHVAFVTEYRDRLTNHWHLLAVTCYRPAGDDPDYTLTRVSVHPAWSGLGVGRSAIQRVADAAARKGCGLVALVPDNRKDIHLWLQWLGWHVPVDDGGRPAIVGDAYLFRRETGVCCGR